MMKKPSRAKKRTAEPGHIVTTARIIKSAPVNPEPVTVRVRVWSPPVTKRQRMFEEKHSEARKEAKRRWGAQGEAWFNREMKDCFSVGIVHASGSRSIYGWDDNSWEEAFADADDRLK